MFTWLYNSGEAAASRVVAGRASFGNEPTPSAQVDAIYRPLSVLKGEIRLVEIQAGSWNTKLCCRLIRASLEHPPPYEALSYTWDAPDFPSRVLVNGTALHITANLEAALRNLRNPLTTRVLWIDAICINQANLADRSTQVSQMHHVYHNAERVVAWLGAEDEETEAQWQFLKDLSAFDTDEEIAASFSDPEDAFEWSRLAVLGWREYWTRVWIYQEIAFAKAAIFKVGKYEVDLEFLFRLLRSCFSAKSSPAPNMVHGSDMVLRSIFGVLAMNFKWLVADLPQGQDRGWMPLLMLLQHSRLQQSSCAHDKVYAKLAMASEDYAGAITVDYSLSVAQVYTQTARFLIETSGTLEVVCNASGDSADDIVKRTEIGLPSWVPNWAGQKMNSIAYCQNYRAAGETLAAPRYVRDGKVIVINGFHLGAIEQVGEAYSAPQIGPESVEVWKRTCTSWIDLIFRSLDDQGNMSEPTWDHWRLLAFFQTLIADRIRSKRRYDRWLFYLAFLLLAEVPIGSVPLAQLHSPYSRSEVETAMKELALSIPRRVLERRIFTMGGNKVMGLAPFAAEVGNSIVVVEGAETPLVLRKSGDGFWITLGDAYVDGFMDGEAMAMVESGEKKWEPFSLE